MKWIRICTLLLALLLMAGCNQTPAEPEAPPEVEVQEPAEAPEVTEPESDAIPFPLPEPLPAYLCTGESQNTVVAADGQVLLEQTVGEMNPLRDQLSGQLVGFLKQEKAGFRTDEHGNVTPIDVWFDLYDVDGTYIMKLSGSRVTAYGDFLLAETADNSRVYSRSQKKVLYNDVVSFWPVEEHVFLSQGIWGTPGTILDSSGSHIADTPAGFAVEGPAGSRYLLIQQNGLCGLLNARGKQVLDCKYEFATAMEGDRVLVYDGQQYAVVNLAKNTMDFQWQYPIAYTFDTTLAVYGNEDYSSMLLMDYKGTPLMGDEFDRITVALEQDEKAVVLKGLRGDQELYFKPDGTILKSISIYSGSLLSENTLLIRGSDKVQVQDLTTGETLCTIPGTDLTAEPLYGDNGLEAGFFLLRQGDRTSVLHESGHVLLEDLEHLHYLGGGVFRCTQGQTTGLLHMDGTWLFQE